jgi:hypothetical protein
VVVDTICASPSVVLEEERLSVCPKLLDAKTTKKINSEHGIIHYHDGGVEVL